MSESLKERLLRELKIGSGKPRPVKSVSAHEAPGPAGPLAVRLYEPEGAATGPLPERVTLLDDVFTTGATAHECALVLARCGVRETRVVTVALG